MLDGGFREMFDIYECIPAVDAPGLKFDFISEVTRHVYSLQVTKHVWSLQVTIHVYSFQVTIHVYTLKFEFIPEVDTRCP